MKQIINILCIFLLASSNPTYKQIIDSGIKPKIDPSYKFPVSKQHQNGCFGFGVKHIAQYKYNIILDIALCEEKIKKPRKNLWNEDHIKNFLDLTGLRLEWKYKASDFFNCLKKGEPVLIQYKYYINKDYWIGHFVAVYSFDQTGVWISESIENRLIHVAYDKIFDKSGTSTDFWFAEVYKNK